MRAGAVENDERRLTKERRKLHGWGCGHGTRSTVIYGHRNMKARLPVRSALVKHVIARLVLQWVTMRESLVP